MYLGNTTLPKRFILLDLQNQYCKSCNSSECTHCLAYEQCTCLITLETVNAYFTKNMACYKVDTVHTTLVDNCVGENGSASLAIKLAKLNLSLTASLNILFLGLLMNFIRRSNQHLFRQLVSHLLFLQFNQKFIIINIHPICYFQMIYIQKIYSKSALMNINTLNLM